MPQTSILVGAIIIATIINIFFCITLRKALFLVRPENRKINPSLIWLLIVPVVSLIWSFVVVTQLSKSLREELDDRNFEAEEQPGLYIGLAYASASCLVNLPLSMTIIGIIGIAGMICFIQYWIKIDWYRKILEQDNVEEAEILEEE